MMKYRPGPYDSLKGLIQVLGKLFDLRPAYLARSFTCTGSILIIFLAPVYSYRR